MAPGFNQPQAWLAEEWSRRLASSLEAMTGDTVSVERQEGRTGREDISAGMAFSLADDPSCTLWAGSVGSGWEALGRRALEAAGIPEAALDDVRSTYKEILTQACSGVAQAVAERLGREVSLTPPEEADKPPAGAAVTRFAVRFPASQPVVMLFASSAALHTTLTTAAASPTSGQAPESVPATSSKTLDLLLEVELPVSVSFGRTQIPLKDALKLSTGSILELNRAVSEPVEVIVNNCVIARGEVVVIEGNYGVRITQVISRQERLRTLH